MTTKIDGTNGIIFPDATTQSTAAVSIGLGQTWQNMLSPSVLRAIGTTYTNSTNKPICVYAWTSAGTTGGGIQITIGSVVLPATYSSSSNTTWVIQAIIPPSTNYTISRISGSDALAGWAELR